ncbi:MAG: acyltransferase [Marinilabiliaceae bacterium]|nr:acyltransferase [Marinilabiliaceae bacterium]
MIKPLMSLRFVFAFFVFINHSGDGANINGVLGWLLKNKFSDSSNVEFFFILSGFLLTLIYEKRISNRSDLLKFYASRIFKIIPAHLFVLTVTLMILPISELSIKWIIKVLINAGLLQSYIPIEGVFFSFNAPTWSISCQLFFYALFPLLIHAQQSLSKRIKISFLAGFALLILVLIQLLPKDLHKAIIYVSPFIRIFDFILGMACAYIWQLNKNKQLKHSTLWELCALTILTSFYFFYSSVPEVYRFSVYYWLPMLLLIFIFSYQGGAISKLLSNKYVYKLRVKLCNIHGSFPNNKIDQQVYYQQTSFILLYITSTYNFCCTPIA